MYKLWRAGRDTWTEISRMSLNQVDLLCMMLDAESEAEWKLHAMMERKRGRR